MVNQQYGNLAELAISGKYRRQGVGEQMVEAAMVWFAGQKVERIEVRVAVSNEISTSFWRKMGFSTYLETMSKPLDLAEQA
jgi:ribosomal protein S18 acetylase RimI-like enzyme